MKDSCWVNQQDGYVTVEQAGSGFDGCLYGTIGYFTLNDTTAWYYGCYGGGCGNVGPYYLYSFKTADDVDIKVSDTFNPPDSETVVTTNDVIVIVNVDGNKIKVPFYQISSENNTINPAANDDIITVEVGSIKKDVKLRLRESKPNGVFDSNDEMIKELVPDNTYIVTCDGVSKEVIADSNGYISAEAYRAKTISLVKKGNEERDDSFAQTIEIPKIEINTIDITDVTMPKGGESFVNTVNCETEGAKIYYTTDGTVPNEVTGKLYEGAIRLEGTEGQIVPITIKAIAVKDGMFTSPVAIFEYIISIPHVHTESDWIIDKLATLDSEGSKHKECTVCHEVLETVAIPKLVDTETGTGSVAKDTSVGEGAPDTNLNNSVSDLYDKVLTDEEKEAAGSGENVKIYLEVNDISDEVSDTDKEKINNKLEDNKLGMFLDISFEIKRTGVVIPVLFYLEIIWMKVLFMIKFTY